MTTTPTTTNTLEARAAWSTITEPGDALAGTLTHTLGHTAALAAATAGADTLIQALLALDVDLSAATNATHRWLPRLPHIDEALAAAATGDITLIDPTTIPGLTDLGENAPHVIWARGNTDALTQATTDRIALIGARAATSYGENTAHELTTSLTDREVTIVGGASYGIDAAAHRAALAAGGSTIAWLAGGLDRPFPAGNAALLARIAEYGTVASEVAPRTAPTRWRFLARNRILAAHTAATIVVESSYRGGSIHTAGHATSLGRNLGAVPGPITSTASAGCHRLMREFGAQTITSAEDAYALLDR